MGYLVALAGLIAGTGQLPPPTAADLSAYREASAHAGRDADAQVRLALWCEAHGLQAERVRHLALAILADPRNAPARGLMGMVSEGGRWRKPEALAEKAREDAMLAEYNARRAKVRETADSQWNLAVWCDEAGLKPEAIAHFTAVVRLDPRREAAWQRLGFKKHKGRWVTDEQLAAERAEALAQQKADRRWKPLLEKWKATTGPASRRAEVEREMAALSDPRAVPSIWRVFAVGKAADQALAARLLGQVDAPAATQGLAMLAVAGASPEVRVAATETLRRRDPREFVDGLIGLLRDPLKYQVKPANGPGTTGVLIVEGERYNVRRDYSMPLTGAIPRLFDGTFSYTPGYGAVAVGFPFAFGTGSGPAVGNLADQLRAHPGQAVDLIGQAANANGGAFQGGSGAGFGNGPTLDDLAQQQAMRDMLIEQQAVEIRRSTIMARQQMLNDVAAVEATNKAIDDDNGRVAAVLGAATGEDLGKDREAWKAWWADRQGYAYVPPKSRTKPKPTVEDPDALDHAVVSYALLPHTSCFAAGTEVRTLEGPRAIESIKVGDRLLTQDTTTGALSFQPALAVFHNKPSVTLKIDLGGGPIVATGIHRFWVAGKGWVMARDLKRGDPVRTLGGLSRVASIEPDQVQPVFNLEVAGGRDFFAGKAGALVHDNSLVLPVAEPFDAPATPDAGAR